MLKDKVIVWAFLFFFMTGVAGVSAAASATYFLSDTCKYCEELHPWLEQIKTQYPQIQITEKEIGKNQDNAQEFMQLMADNGIAREDWGIPAIYINGKVLLGIEKIMEHLEYEIQQ